MSTPTPDQAVGNYLAFISDPESLRDEPQIIKLQEQLDLAEDPLDKLAIRDKLEQLRNLSEDDFLPGFIEFAKEYADNNDISASAFASMGVEQRVLRLAGFSTNSTYVTVGTVIKKIRESSLTSFTQQGAVELSKAAHGTVRKAITNGLDDGSIILTDEEDLTHSGRGSKPQVYRLRDAQASDDHEMMLNDLSTPVAAEIGTEIGASPTVNTEINF